MAEPVVVVGGGLTAANVVQTLRDEGFNRPITIVGDEPERPYERPKLSKEYLLDKLSIEDVYVHPARYYPGNDVTTRFGDGAVGLDLANRRVRLSSGDEITYEYLVLATGARPRTLDLPGADQAGVMTLRRIGDARRLRAELLPGRRLVVIGGGWIGLEVAAAARQHDVEVTILEAGDRPLGNVLGPQLADHFANLHRAHGVDLRTGVSVSGLTGEEGHVTGVQVSDQTVPADVVLVGVGAIPNTELASDAGLAVDKGVLVDDQLRTADPAVLAAGDVARAFHTTLGPLRVEHWDNAIRQGQLAAATILGRGARYDWQPYFYTDQYDLGMEYVGHAGPQQDVVVRGDMASGEFIVFWVDGDLVRAAMNVNIWDVNETLRGIVGREIPRARLADPSIPLAKLG